MINLARATLMPLVALVISMPVAQERAANGQIYGELLPFVGLKGVRLEIHGLGGAIWNLRPGGGVADPDTEITGLSRAEQKQLFETIKADATEVLQVAGIPLADPAGSTNDKPPRLVLRINSHRYRPDAIGADVTIELVEAARLLRDPGTVVSSSTWADRSSAIFSDSASLAAWVRSVARNQVRRFAELYTRAHAPAN